jgi:hypothetical protein
MQQHYKSPPVVQGPGLVDVPVTKPISGGAVASIKDAELHIDSRIRSLYIRQGNFRSEGLRRRGSVPLLGLHPPA